MDPVKNGAASCAEIRPLLPSELTSTLALLAKFYSHLPVALLEQRLHEISELNWDCIGVFEREKLIALSGYWLNTRLYCGKYLYIDHFIVDSPHRGAGVGTQLLQYMKQLAKKNHCEQVCLDTFVANSPAQAFWSRHGFTITGFHYISH